IKIYTQTNFYLEDLISVVKPGMSGAEEIKQMMADFRENPPKSFDNSKIIRLDDYQSSISKDLISGKETQIEIPKSNVLIFYTEDGSKIAARPSGTEPKIKFYFSVKTHLNEIADFEETKVGLQQKIERLKNEFK